MEERKVLLGQVSVDSGTLLIVDPGSLESWTPRRRGKTIGVEFWGAQAADLAKLLQDRGYDVLPYRQGRTSLCKPPAADEGTKAVEELQALIAGIQERFGWHVLSEVATENSFDQMLATIAGQLGAEAGPGGVALHLADDGGYNVYAYLRPTKDGEELARIEIEI